MAFSYDANTTATLNPTIVLPMIQQNLEKKAVARAIADARFREYLTAGDEVDFNTMSRLHVKDYTPGTPVDSQGIVFESSKLLINQTRMVNFSVNSVQVSQAAVKKQEAELASEAGYQLANDVDQYVLDTLTSGAGSSVNAAATALTNTTTYDAFTDARAELKYNRAAKGRTFAVIDPATEALISQELAASGNNMADKVLSEAFSGTFNRFDVYVSDNLKSTTVLDMATNPTAGDTFTLLGQTWTFVANGTAAAAGDISIGADAATTQAIVVNALNGTGTPGASTYIEISQDARDKYVEAQVTAGDFSGDASTITGYGRLKPSSDFTAAANDFQAETNNLAFGDYDAVALGMQMMPQLKVGNINGEMADEYKMCQLYGAKVFSRYADRIVTYKNIVTAAEA